MMMFSSVASRKVSQGLQKGAFLRVPAVDLRHVRPLKDHSLHPSSDLYLVQLYMHERGFLYPARVLPLYMSWHLLTGP
jgi:hypothetical protein